MKTIAITVPFGMSVRNILSSDVASSLSKQAKLLVLSPYAADPAFVKEYTQPNIIFAPLPFENSLPARLLRKILDPVETYLFTAKTKIVTFNMYRDWLRDEHPCRYWKIRLLAAIFGHQPLLGILRRLNLQFFRNANYQKLFKEHAVSLVFITHLFNHADQQVAVNAQLAGIPVVGMVHSWDNLTSKSGIRQGTNPDPGRIMPIKLNRMIVWNNLMKQELLNHYDYKESEVDLSGIPQFDFYTQRQKFTPRDQLLKSLGADPAKKLLLYAAGTPQYVHHQDEVVRILIDILEKKTLSQSSQLLIRHHPNRMAIESLSSLEKQFKGNKNIFFYAPPSLFTARSDAEWNARQGDEFDLANMLNAADVVITMASTITIDSAAMDKPVINIAFDGYDNEPYFRSLRRCFDFTHYANIVSTGAFKIAHDPEELTLFINRYLDNPNLEKENRKALTNLVNGPLDGKASERIASYVLACLK